MVDLVTSGTIDPDRIKRYLFTTIKSLEKVPMLSVVVLLMQPK